MWWHGRLKLQEKADIMAKFKAGGHFIFVPQPGSKVEVDVPNSSLMV